MKKLFIYCLCFLTAFAVQAQKEYNFRSTDPGRPQKTHIAVEPRYDIVYGKDSVSVFVYLRYLSGYEKVKTERYLRILYELTEEPGAKVIRTDTARIVLKPTEPKSFYFVLQFAYSRQPAVALLIESQEWEKTGEVSLHVPLSLHKKEVSGKLNLFELNVKAPWQANYCNVKDTVVISETGTFKAPLYLAFTPASQFDCALPPMVTEVGGEAEPKLKFVPFRTDSVIHFLGAGRYVASKNIQEEGSNNLVFFVGQQRYPSVAKLEDLKAPLIYITTEAEFTKISTATKEGLDAFWLNFAGNKDLAKKTLKSFYQRVAYANEYYTEYKEGWKTDRGMIYLVLGRPDDIKRENPMQEVWVYNGGNKVSFTFNKKSDPYKGLYFELKRETGFEEPWFKAVEKWRRGIIDQ